MIITVVTYGDYYLDSQWDRGGWVATGPGTMALKWETDFDLSIVLRNIAVVIALSAAEQRGREWIPDDGMKVCDGCGQFIDEEMCPCGTPSADHTISDGHSPGVMGCICYQSRREDMP